MVLIKVLPVVQMILPEDQAKAPPVVHQEAPVKVVPVVLILPAALMKIVLVVLMKVVLVVQIREHPVNQEVLRKKMNLACRTRWVILPKGILARNRRKSVPQSVVHRDIPGSIISVTAVVNLRGA